jgi:hypothetical protein
MHPLDDRIIGAFAKVLDVRDGTDQIDFAKTLIAIIQRGTITADEYSAILGTIESVSVVDGKVRGSRLQKTATYTKNTLTSRAGQGSYGVVHKSAATYAYKSSSVSNKEDFLKILTELFIQTTLASDPVHGINISAPIEFNIIVSAVGAVKTLLKMEFIGTTFDGHFDSMDGVTYESMRPFLKELAQILKHFNDTYGFLHCDLHKGNIMFDVSPGGGFSVLKLIDFGFSTIRLDDKIYSASKTPKNTSDLLLLFASILGKYTNTMDDLLKAFMIRLFDGTIKKGYGHLFRMEDGAAINGYGNVLSTLRSGQTLFHKFYYYEKYGNLTYVDYPYMHYSAFLELIDTHDTDRKIESFLYPAAPLIENNAPLLQVPGYNKLLYSLLGLSPPTAAVAALAPIPEEASVPGRASAPGAAKAFPSKPFSSLYTGPTITESNIKRRLAAAAGAEGEKLSGTKRRASTHPKNNSTKKKPAKLGGARRTRNNRHKK